MFINFGNYTTYDGVIKKKKKDGGNAIKSSEEALRTAEEIGDWVGAKRACEMLLEFHKNNDEGKKRYSQKLKEIQRKL